MVDLKITLKMHEYPKEVPQEGRHDILALNTEGEIKMCYYMKDHASRPHSVWQSNLYWCYEAEAYATIKESIQQIQLDALKSKRRGDRYNEIIRLLHALQGQDDPEARERKRQLHEEADNIETDMKAHGEI